MKAVDTVSSAAEAGCAAYPRLDHRKSCSLQVGPACAITPHTPGWSGFSKTQEELPQDEYQMGMKSRLLRDGNNNNVYFAAVSSSSLPPSPPKMERF